MSDPEESIDCDKIKEAVDNNGKNDEHKDKDRITCRQDLTPYFKKRDHSINKLHCTRVSH